VNLGRRSERVRDGPRKIFEKTDYGIFKRGEDFGQRTMETMGEWLKWHK